MSCEPPGDSLGAQVSQGRADEGIGPYVVCRRTDCDRRDPSERVKPVYPMVCNGICYATVPQERYRAIPNGLAIPDRLAHALAVGPADHALPAGAPGAQGHCSLVSVPMPSGTQQPIDSRPADHALPAGAPGAQGHCSLASVPTSSGTQRPNDSRPAVHAPSAATRR